MTIDQITEFLGWCSVLNIALLTLAALSIMVLRNPIMSLHHALFGIEKEALPDLYLKYLAAYKILILMTNLVPYIALKLMAG
ncbi:DUF6868 family protein [Sneathiella limimaris]|uniref:DUF6868 family protein n=1 Tax=Sneathiella limimaris TaxID=1964213 RepID=UPI001469B181|nr:hypothetical protein [Sneathiella limimaris]